MIIVVRGLAPVSGRVLDVALPPVLLLTGHLVLPLHTLGLGVTDTWLTQAFHFTVIH